MAYNRTDNLTDDLIIAALAIAHNPYHDEHTANVKGAAEMLQSYLYLTDTVRYGSVSTADLRDKLSQAAESLTWDGHDYDYTSGVRLVREFLGLPNN